MKPQIEVLAPAGSMESMAAAIHAGADAVYMGGSRFGARAYADNPLEDEFLRAIDYAHIHGSKLYMTVNTLVKEGEMKELADFLKPYYLQGLDGAIVQDLGVFSLIRDIFPDLPIHVSTQMTVTGPGFARLLENMGASRVVTARELSLEEIGRIRQKTNLELECFVHGALCYCYSGQCFMSSLIGGRSGNRGRCAQPCRLPYEVEGKNRKEKAAGRWGKAETLKKRGKHDRGKGSGEALGTYVMNLKDLCTLELLPDILDGGVYSLKIEGRMKSPRYTAGVVRIYRKYVDRYVEKGREGYIVDPEDKRQLLELFDRGGFTQGYYRKQNGRDMIALGAKPGFREKDQALFDFLDREYVKKKKQEPVIGRLSVRQGMEIRLELKIGEEPGRSAGADWMVCVAGNLVQEARKQPVTREQLLKQMNKTGESSFYFQKLEIELSKDCFVSVQELNELRRRGLQLLEQKIVEEYRRTGERSRGMPGEGLDGIGREEVLEGDAYLWRGKEELPKRQDGTRMGFHVSLEDLNLFSVALTHPDVDEIYLDCVGFGAGEWQEAAEACHKAGKKCALIMPHIFREKAEQYFINHKGELLKAGFDELIVKSLEEISFLKEEKIRIPVVMDANVYGMNRRACKVLFEMGASRLTLPLELNERELLEMGLYGQELIVYGHLPSMVSAQCVQQTIRGCTGRPEILYMKDRTGKEFPVKNHCQFCYNTIYNPDPLSLLGLEEQVKKLELAAIRLEFTVETKEEMKAVLDGFGESFLRGEKGLVPFSVFTRGHFKRGVE